MIEGIFFNPWIWILAVAIGLTVAIAIIGIVYWRVKRPRDTWDEGEGGIVAAIISGIIALILSLVYFGFVLPPYDASFYQTYRIAGEVTQVEAVFSGDEGTMSQVFVAKVEGVNEFIRSDDQRFRTVEAGDSVNLVCSKEFRYFQEPWFECAFGGERR